MRIVKSSVALLLGAALVTSAVPGQFSLVGAAEKTSSVSETPTATPSASPSTSPTGTPAPSSSTTPTPTSSATPAPTNSATPNPTTTPVGKPGVPKLSVKAGAGKLTFIVKKPKNATGYTLRYKVGNGRWYSFFSYFPKTGSKSKHIQLVEKKGTYTVQVRGRVSTGGKVLYSKWSKKKKAKVKKLKKYKNPNMNYDEH